MRSIDTGRAFESHQAYQKKSFTFVSGFLYICPLVRKTTFRRVAHPFRVFSNSQSPLGIAGFYSLSL